MNGKNEAKDETSRSQEQESGEEVTMPNPFDGITLKVGPLEPLDAEAMSRHKRWLRKWKSTVEAVKDSESYGVLFD